MNSTTPLLTPADCALVIVDAQAGLAYARDMIHPA